MLALAVLPYGRRSGKMLALAILPYGRRGEVDPMIAEEVNRQEVNKRPPIGYPANKSTLLYSV